jgi:glucose-1-phosphate cytidylyltransferase
MKVGILAGGLGTRLAEETEIRPKPMVEIGGKPILWHIMKHYLHFGFDEFVIALGYKGDQIKRYIAEYYTYNDSNLTVDLRNGNVETVRTRDLSEKWTCELIETGANTSTGGRIKRLAPYMGSETFMLTYGDGVSNVDLRKLLEFHRSHGRLATLTGVHPPARFGKLDIVDGKVARFTEKPTIAEKPELREDSGPAAGEGWISGGFFVLEPGIFDYIEGDDTSWEREPLDRLAKDGELVPYLHYSFWQCMDTLRDKTLLEGLWDGGNPPWKVWDR